MYPTLGWAHDTGLSLKDFLDLSKVQAVAAMLGHARLSTAQIYTRVSPVRMLDVYRKSHPHAQQNH